VKSNRSPDCRLKLAYMKLESLVIAKQHVAVNMFLGFVHTARHILEIYSQERFVSLAFIRFYLKLKIQ
jgi:hypothetical protein